ncbi:hypothetical protein [Burkholderia ubonensis]|uniref:hypothetical protein n=1 Tax=Burkholderia ubonensis TaxID=101571 RepID=UPI0012FA1EFA|nr:hypothetical protein [Burkholderia ubonensis]
MSVQLSESVADRVVLTINYGPSSVRFQDLTGNGPETYSSDRHKKGYGKLLVNVAIQVLQRSPWITPETPIHGTITDEREDVTDFWSKFGMTVRGVDPSDGSKNGNGQITGKLGDLHPVVRNYKAGGIFDLSLDLSHFRTLDRQERKERGIGAGGA